MITKSKIKFIQSLSHKKLRDEAGLFVAEGPKLFRDLLELPNMELQEVYATREWIDSEPLAGSLGEKVTELEPSYLERISSLQTPNQVVAIFKKPVFEIKEPFKGRITLVLDGIQDPGNLGTMIRCADWFGIETILCSADSVDAFNNKVVQSTMGSIGRVQVLYGDLATILRENEQVAVYAATLEGKNIFEMDRPEQGFIVIGNEARGVSDAILDLTTHRITIPRVGKAESLNASVAAGIIMAKFCI